jgi:hypothetical protein
VHCYPDYRDNVIFTLPLVCTRITGDDVARALDYVIRAGVQGVVNDVTMNVVVVPVDFPLQTVEIGVETLRIALMTGPVEDKLVIPLRNSDCDACGNVLVWPALSDGVLASIASSTLCVDIGRCCVSTGPSGTRRSATQLRCEQELCNFRCVYCTGVPSTAIHTKAHARVGIMGNPSDGFFGKTVAATIEGFWAEAWAWPSPDPKIHFIPNHLYDPMVMPSSVASGVLHSMSVFVCDADVRQPEGVECHFSKRRLRRRSTPHAGNVPSSVCPCTTFPTVCVAAVHQFLSDVPHKRECL